MNRQYVGARYVPKFYENPNGGCEWLDNVSYEPLTIVTYGSNSFTSKRAVPSHIGNPSANPSYWASTGNYNAQVEEYRQATENVINDVARISMKTEERNVLLIGDSYSVGNDMLGNQYNSWSTLLQQYVNFDYCGVIKAGGTGFTGKEGATSGASETLCWINHLRTYVANTPSEILNKINAVYILGGFNDHYASYATTIRTRMSEFFSYARSVLPNAKFYLGLVGWAGLGECVTPQGTFKCGEVRDKIKRVVLPAYNSCGAYGCTYIGNLFACLHDYGTSFSDDHYHPNQNGHNFIARSLASYVLGGSFSINFNETTVVASGGVNHTALNCNLVGDTVTILKGKPTASILINEGLNILVGQSVKIGTVTTGCVLGSPNLTIDCWISYSGAFRRGSIEIDAVGDVYLWNFGDTVMEEGNPCLVRYATTSVNIADC